MQGNLWLQIQLQKHFRFDIIAKKVAWMDSETWSLQQKIKKKSHSAT